MEKDNQSQLVWNKPDALKRLGNSQSLLKEVLTMFVESAATMEQDILNSINAKDISSFRVNVHTLKGVLANLSAERAITVGEQMEHLADIQDTAATLALFEELKRQVAAFTVEAQNYLSGI